MSSLFRMRPRYELRTPLTPAQLRARIGGALAAPSATCRGRLDDHKVEITTRGEHHFWSPELRALFRADDDGCRLVGRFGPKPAVWTMFTVIYLHLVFIAVAGGVYAMAQLTLGWRPTAAWAVPIALALAVIVRAIAHIGQSLGSDEMDRIRVFVAGAAADGEP